MGKQLGNGAIQIQITVYPNYDGGKRYDQCVTRSLSIDHLESLEEVDRVAYNMGELVTSTIVAMKDTLRQREMTDATSQVVQVEEELPE